MASSSCTPSAECARSSEPAGCKSRWVRTLRADVAHVMARLKAEVYEMQRLLELRLFLTLVLAVILTAAFALVIFLMLVAAAVFALVIVLVLAALAVVPAAAVMSIG